MLDRRHFLTTLMALPLLGAAARAGGEPACTKATMTEDGLHMQPWFIQNSFLDLKEELEAARQAGKMLAIVVERKGCPYCARMHEDYFTRPEVCAFVRKNFAILQINKLGSREVTDFDGQTMSESEWTKKHRAFYTPITLFYDPDIKTVLKGAPDKMEAARMDGLMAPDMFIAMYHYVHDKGYRTGSFMKYIQAQARKG